MPNVLLCKQKPSYIRYKSIKLLGKRNFTARKYKTKQKTGNAKQLLTFQLLTFHCITFGVKLSETFIQGNKLSS